MDMRFVQYATEDKPLVEGCSCHTCCKHTRAYINHLLNAREMLAWTLLQVHNMHTMEKFFESVRQSIQRKTFDQDLETFGRRYEKELPKGTGSLPTRRGYQSKSSTDSEKQPKSYNKFDDVKGDDLAHEETVMSEVDPNKAKSELSTSEQALFSMSDPENYADNPNAEEKIIDEMTLKTKNNMFARMSNEAVEMDGSTPVHSKEKE